MTLVTLTPHGQPNVTTALVRAWTRLDTDIGVQDYDRAGVQFRCARGGWYTIRVVFDDGRVWHAEGYLPPRAILTVRPDSPAPTNGLLRLRGDPSDFSGGGGTGIDACGANGTVHHHDEMVMRHPVGLFDMVTGKLRDAASIPVAGYYRGTRGLNEHLAWNKVGQPPEYVTAFVVPPGFDLTKIDPDWRSPADSTPIPEHGKALRALVLKWQAFDLQHLIRAFRFAILLQHDPIVRDDMRAMLRDAELAWSAKREEDILKSTGGRGHSEVGREWAWVSYLAALVERWDNRIARTLRSLFGVGFASRMRRIARHVAHRETGILQRFVEGMSGSPYPYGDKPNSGVPVGQSIALTQHLEACAQITALDALGMKAESTKLARTILSVPGLKWFNTDTGNPAGGGWHGPASDQVWPAVAVWLRNDPEHAEPELLEHRVPTDGGSSVKCDTQKQLQDAHAAWSDRGKNRWFRDELVKVMARRAA